MSREIPEGKQINGFTGELEDAPKLNLSASPTDQRILAAPPHTDPLPELIDRAIYSDDDTGLDVGEHTGPSLQEDSLPGETPLPVIPQHDTPEVGGEQPVQPVEHTDIPPANKRALEEGAVAATDGAHYPGQDTKAYNDSIEARKEAEAEGVKPEDLPEIEPPVIADDAKRTADDPDYVTEEDDTELEEEDEDDVPVPTSSDEETPEDTGSTEEG